MKGPRLGHWAVVEVRAFWCPDCQAFRCFPRDKAGAFSSAEYTFLSCKACGQHWFVPDTDIKEFTEADAGEG